MGYVYFAKFVPPFTGIHSGRDRPLLKVGFSLGSEPTEEEKPWLKATEVLGSSNVELLGTVIRSDARRHSVKVHRVLATVTPTLGHNTYDLNSVPEDLLHELLQGIALQRRATPKRSGPSGKRSITQEDYNKLLNSFRQHGDNFRAVAEECGVHWNTAKKAWNEGWDHQASKPWALAISNVIKKEQIEARAALQREKDDLVQDRRIARQDQLREAVEAGFTDLVESRAKQGKVIRAARDNSIVALIVSQKLLKAAVPLSDKVVQDLQDSDLDVFQRMRLLRQLGRFTHDAIEMAQVVEEMERKALGEPDTILEVQGGISMTVEEAKATLLEVGAVLQKYEAGDEADEVIDAEWSDNGNLALKPGNTKSDDD